MSPSPDVAAFTALLTASNHIIAIASRFRGAGGLWRKYDAMSLATPESFYANPALVWQFYHYRRETALRAQCNAAHMALAAFSSPQVRDAIAPGSTFTLITQNVDGLSVRALDLSGHTLSPSEQPKILEMHGRLFDVQCTPRSCGYSEFNLTSPICDVLAGTEVLVDAGVLDPDIPEASLPRCSKCNSLSRPGVVWFGETPQHLDAIETLVDQADLCLVIGTSSTVYPAAGYAFQVQDHGGKMAIFNLDHSEGDEEADFLFLGPCEETLPKALGLTI